MKKVVFLLGSMGAGKSTILQEAKPARRDRYITYCDDFDILGSEIGADSLSGYKKEDVLSSLKNYHGQKLVVAGVYYSKQIDIERFRKLGFEIHCILLSVPREDIYRRVLTRGNGAWNEATYASNLKSAIAFFRKVNGNKTVMKNVEAKDIVKIYRYLKEI